MDANATVVDIIVDAVTKTTGLIAASASLILVVVAGPREFKKWRRQKLAERKAEVAAAALVAAIDLLDRMVVVSTPVGLKDDPVQEKDQSYYAFMRKLYGKRLEFIKPQSDALEKQRMLAHVYLTDEQNKVLGEISAHVNQFYGDILTWTGLAEAGDAYREQWIEAFNRAIGEEPERVRSDLKSRVTEALRGSAHFKEVE